MPVATTGTVVEALSTAVAPGSVKREFMKISNVELPLSVMTGGVVVEAGGVLVEVEVPEARDTLSIKKPLNWFAG